MDSAPMTHNQRNHVPPGTRNGRWWCGYFLRSMITAGIWKMYIIAVSETITETMTPKKVGEAALGDAGRRGSRRWSR